MSTKNSNDPIGSRTRDLPACSAVPQPTAPPRAPTLPYNEIQSITTFFPPSVGDVPSVYWQRIYIRSLYPSNGILVFKPS
jgi:hypothetical protein